MPPIVLPNGDRREAADVLLDSAYRAGLIDS
jgi:hypothetical protein